MLFGLAALIWVLGLEFVRHNLHAITAIFDYITDILACHHRNPCMMSGKPLQDVTDILALRWVYMRYAADPFMAPMLFLHDCKATILRHCIPP